MSCGFTMSLVETHTGIHAKNIVNFEEYREGMGGRRAYTGADPYCSYSDNLITVHLNLNVSSVLVADWSSKRLPMGQQSSGVTTAQIPCHCHVCK
jgi:hypothetical protein